MDIFNQPNPQVEASKITLPDGRVAFDAVKLAQAEMEGVFLKDIPDNSRVLVQTVNTLYQFDFKDGQIIGVGGKYLPEPVPVEIHGSTWGGSMLKIQFIGIDMHLEFHVIGDDKSTVTSAIRNIKITEIPCPSEPTKN
jgi:hypothetical protein